MQFLYFLYVHRLHKPIILIYYANSITYYTHDEKHLLGTFTSSIVCTKIDAEPRPYTI